MPPLTNVTSHAPPPPDSRNRGSDTQTGGRKLLLTIERSKQHVRPLRREERSADPATTRVTPGTPRWAKGRPRAALPLTRPVLAGSWFPGRGRMEGRAVIAHEYMGFLGGVVAQPCEYPESHSTGHLRRVNCLVYEVYPAVWGGGSDWRGRARRAARLLPAAAGWRPPGEAASG